MVDAPVGTGVAVPRRWHARKCHAAAGSGCRWHPRHGAVSHALLSSLRRGRVDAPGISKPPVVLSNGSWDGGGELRRAGLSSRVPQQGSNGVCGGFGAQRGLLPLCWASPRGSRSPWRGGRPPPVPGGRGDSHVQAASCLGSRGRGCPVLGTAPRPASVPPSLGALSPPARCGPASAPG